MNTLNNLKQPVSSLENKPFIVRVDAKLPEIIGKTMSPLFYNSRSH